MKKTFAFLTMMLILSIALVACGGGTALECPEGDVCVEVAPDEPVRIGYAFVVSGADVTLGTDTKRGVGNDRGRSLFDNLTKMRSTL